jgi:carbamate kinase
MKKLAVLALGGNALEIPKSERQRNQDFINEEGQNILRTLQGIEILIRAGPLIITHGNGPQVGRILDKQNLPLWLCTAQTQGELGILIQQALVKYLKRHRIKHRVISTLTQVLIDAGDKAFRNPTKPIGHFYSETKAKRLSRKSGYGFREDLAGRGWRRLVPSPKPLEVVELELIKFLLAQKVIVIAGGGGGVPVYLTKDGLIPVEAVIDKDFTSALIASELSAEMLIILTNIKKVKLSFGKPDEKSLDKLTVTEAEHWLKQAQFGTGSMQPKIEAGISFLKNGGNKVLITHVFQLKQALQGRTGTVITK